MSQNHSYYNPRSIQEFEKPLRIFKFRTSLFKDILCIEEKLEQPFKPNKKSLCALNPNPSVLKIPPFQLVQSKKSDPTLKFTKVLSQSTIKQKKKEHSNDSFAVQKLNIPIQLETKFKSRKHFDLWKINNKIPGDCKVFIICGNYPDLRAALLKRNWCENTFQNSLNYDFKFSRNARIPFGIQDWQLYNHYPKNFQLTSKWNLCKILNLSLFTGKSSLGFFPRCFRLSNSGFRDFGDYFKVVFAVSLLKNSISMPGSVHYEKIGASISIAKSWLSKLKTENSNYEGKIVSDYDWQILNIYDLKIIGLYYSRYYMDADLTSTSQAVMEELEAYDPQFHINGTKNIWIVKPGHKSRGRNISLHTSIKEIYEFSNTNEHCVVQKYIENPLLINSKKFDIRQWVLVCSNKPSQIWLFKECYLRFTINDYTSDELSDVFCHLTNNSISKKSKEFHNADIEGCMWSLKKFQDFLIQEKGFDVWTEKLLKDIKKIVINTVGSVNLGRKKSFELFGYDLMVDDQFNTWLIEINSSPAMDYSTAVTEGLVKKVMEDMVKVVSDYPEVEDTGNFELICVQ